MAVIAGSTKLDAYRKAGGKCKGRAATQAASQMGKAARVEAFLSSMNDELIAEGIMGREEALQRLSAMARASITDIANFRNVQIGVDENDKPVFQTVWELKNADQMTPEMALIIHEVTASKDGLKLKIHDQKEALKQLATLQGWEAPKKTMDIPVTQKVAERYSKEDYEEAEDFVDARFSD